MTNTHGIVIWLWTSHPQIYLFFFNRLWVICAFNGNNISGCSFQSKGNQSPFQLKNRTIFKVHVRNSFNFQTWADNSSEDIRPSDDLSVNFSRFHLLLQNYWEPILTKLGIKLNMHFWVKEFKFVQMKGNVVFQGEIIKYENTKKTLPKSKNLLLQNQRANFNQTWHKASLGWENSSLFKWRTTPFSEGEW